MPRAGAAVAPAGERRHPAAHGGRGVTRSQRSGPQVVNRLPRYLRRRGIAWGELARRALLPATLVGRLREPGANPRLAVAERIAAALGVAVEHLWELAPGRPGAR